MGWFAAGGCTLIAGLLLFSLHSKKFRRKQKPEIYIHDATEDYNDTLHKDEVSQKNARRSGTTPTISINPSEEGPLMADGLHSPESQESSITSVRETFETSVPQSAAKGLSMPPPPRPASAPIPNPTAPRFDSMPPPSSLPPSRNRSPPRLKPPTASVPPRRPPTLNGGNLRPPPSSASSLRVPPQRVLQNTHMQPSLAPSSSAASISTLPPSQRPSRKVILSPGHSPLDWAALQRSTSSTAPVTLRGRDATSFTNGSPIALLRVTPSMLKAQTGRKGKDAWTSFQGRVYNISAYLPFHPGGEPELMKGAGKRSDELFAEVHPWVNWEGMLGECCVGILVSEEEGGHTSGGSGMTGNGGSSNSGGLDEMD